MKERRKYNCGDKHRAHFEMSVEEWLESKRHRPMSKWMLPVPQVHPRPTPPKKGDDAEVRAHWAELMAKQGQANEEVSGKNRNPVGPAHRRSPRQVRNR